MIHKNDFLSTLCLADMSTAPRGKFVPGYMSVCAGMKHCTAMKMKRRSGDIKEQNGAKWWWVVAKIADY